MANRFLVIQKIALSLTLIVGLCCISQAQASARQTIRFYKVDRQIQADRIKFTKKKASNPGCHSFRKKARVYKTVQIGYNWCSLYSKKDCTSESIINLSKQDPAEILKAAEEAALRKARKRAKIAKKKIKADEAVLDDSGAVAAAKSPKQEDSEAVVEPEIIADESLKDKLEIEDQVEAERKSTPVQAEDSEPIVEPESIEAEPIPEPIVDQTLTQEMTEGIAWYPLSKHRRGVKVGSWNCSLTTKQSSD